MGVIDINSSVRRFEIGAISSFIGAFLADVFEQVRESHYEPIDVGTAPYYASVLAGSFSAIIIPEVGLFAGVLLAVGLNKVLFDVIDRFTCGEGLDYSTFLRDFILDSIIIFFIILIINEIISMTSKEDTLAGQEEVAQEETVLESAVISAVVNIYYKLKR